MAGSTITYPLNGASNWENFTDIVQKIQSGFMRVSLSNFDNDSEPQIEGGSLLDVNGSVCVFSAAESITGWSGISAGNDVYIYVTVTGSSVTVSFSTTAPTYSAAKRGYYNGNDRCIGGLYKVSASKYSQKWIYPGNGEARIKDGSVMPTGLTFDGSPAEEATYGPAVTLNDPVSKGQPILFLHNRYGSGSSYVWKRASNILAPYNSNSYGPIVVYLGDDLWAHILLESGATYYLRLRIMEHNWGSMTWTQRGSTTTIWSGTSNFRNPLFLAYLGDVSGAAQLAIVCSRTSGMEAYTYSINKSSYTISQIGSVFVLHATGTFAWWYGTGRAFMDQWQRFWYIGTETGSGNTTVEVWSHDGDGTYTQDATQTIFTGMNSNRMINVPHPFKLSATKYRWVTAAASGILQDPLAGFFAVDFEDATDTITKQWEAWRFIEDTSYEYKGYNMLPYLPGTPSKRAWTANYCAGTGPKSMIILCQNTGGTGDCWKSIQTAIPDITDEQLVVQDWIRFANTYSNDTSWAGLILFHKNGIAVWNAPLRSYDLSATSWFTQHCGAVFIDNFRKIHPLGFQYIEDVGASSRNPDNYDIAFDGRIIFSYENSNAGAENSYIQYVPICLGIADADYVAGDIVRPLIRGKLRGMSGEISYTQMGNRLSWDISGGDVVVDGGGVPVGRIISDDIWDIDVPMDGLPYDSIDNRLS